MIIAGTNYHESRLYGNRENGLTMKMWRKLNTKKTTRMTSRSGNTHLDNMYTP